MRWAPRRSSRLRRIVAKLEPQRTIRFLWCNEEHTPWTSVLAANNMRQRKDNLVAIFNIDSLGGKSQAGYRCRREDQRDALHGRRRQGLGRPDDGSQSSRTRLGLRQSVTKRPNPGDDDGSFVNAGYNRAIVNVGSFPYADPEYHLESDVADRVDYENVRLATQAILAAVLHVDQCVVNGPTLASDVHGCRFAETRQVMPHRRPRIPGRHSSGVRPGRRAAVSWTTVPAQ